MSRSISICHIITVCVPSLTVLTLIAHRSEVQKRLVRFVGEHHQSVMPVVVPPSMLGCKCAVTLAAVLAASEPVPVAQLASMSHVTCCIREIDGAHTNDASLNIEWAALSKQASNIVQKRVRCFVHQQHLVSGATLAVVASPKMELVNGMFAASQLLRVHDYWEHILDMLPKAIALYLVVVVGPAPAAATACADVVIAATGLDPTDPDTIQMRRNLNGCWIDPDADPVQPWNSPIVVYTDDPLYDRPTMINDIVYSRPP